MKKRLLFVVWLAGALYGQTVINGDRKILGQWDASVSTATLPFSVGTLANLPATCNVGQMYFATDGAAGRNLQSCLAPNSWRVVGYQQGTTAGLPAACAVGDLYFASDAPAGSNLFGCGAANVWTRIGGASSGIAGGDLSGSYPSPSVAAINGTTVPVNAAGDQVLATTGPKTATWTSIANCPAGVLQYSTALHAFSCGTLSTGGTVTHSTGALSAGAILAGNGGADLAVPNAAATIDSSGNVATPGGLTTGIGSTASGSMTLSGFSSGTVTQTVSSDAGTWTFKWPSAPSSAHQWLTTDTSGVASFTQPAFADIGGILAPAQLPAPGASSLGGIQSLAASAHKWVNAISTSGVPGATQPTDADIAFSDVTTGNVSTAAHGYAPKAPNDATRYLDGSGAWSVPPASGGMVNPMTTAGDLIIGGSGGTPTRLAAASGYPHWTGSGWQFDIPSGAGATIPSVTNLIAGSGGGNGADSGIAPSNVSLLNGGNAFTGYNNFSTGRFRPPEATFASAPSSPLAGQIFVFTDATTAGTCTGGGSARALCRYTGTAYEALGGAGGGSGSSYYQTLIGAQSPTNGNTSIGPNNVSRTARPALQVRNNLSLTDDGTNSILDFNMLDARTVFLDEEFLGAGLTNGYGLFSLGWRLFNAIGGACGGINQVSSGDSWPNLGVARLTTSATAQYGCQLALNNNGGNLGQLGSLGSNSGWGLLWVFRLGSTANIRVNIGAGSVGGVLGYLDVAGTFGIRYDTHTGVGDTNFMFYFKPTSGNDVAVSTGVAADTNFHTLIVYSSTVGTIRMSLDGGVEKTFCSSGCDGTLAVPTTQMEPFATLLTDSASAQTLDLDAFKFQARVNTGVSNKRN